MCFSNHLCFHSLHRVVWIFLSGVALTRSEVRDNVCDSSDQGLNNLSCGSSPLTSDSTHRIGDYLMSSLASSIACEIEDPPPATWTCIFEGLYKHGGASGFDGTQTLGSQGGEGVYGEIVPQSLQYLLEVLSIGALDPLDQFVDLGSGAGRSVIQAFGTGISALGVELSLARHKIAVVALDHLCQIVQSAHNALCSVQEAHASLQIGRHKMTLEHGDMLRADIEGSTMIFLNSVCFSDELLRAVMLLIVRLPLGTMIASFKKIPGPAAGLFLLKQDYVSTTFQHRTPTYIYVVAAHFQIPGVPITSTGLEAVIMEEWALASGGLDVIEISGEQFSSYLQSRWPTVPSFQSRRCSNAVLGFGASATVSKASFISFFRSRWQGNARSLLQRAHADLAMSVRFGEDLSLHSVLPHELIDHVAPDGKTLLHVAHGTSKELIGFLLQQKADVHASTKTGSQPIHIASSEANQGMVEALIEARADIDSRRQNGATPLFDALDALPSVRTQMVEFLIAQGASVNARDRSGQSLLTACVRAGHAGVVKLLLKHQADPMTVADDGSTPLHEAQKPEVVSLLLGTQSGKESAAVINRAGRTPLETAFFFNRLDVAEYLVEHSALAVCPSFSADHSLSDCLFRAVRRGSILFVQWLLNHGADKTAVDASGLTAHALAMSLGMESIAAILAEKCVC